MLLALIRPRSRECLPFASDGRHEAVASVSEAIQGRVRLWTASLHAQ